ncbi:hypothetical protein D3C83_93480 [compost metagenome]
MQDKRPGLAHEEQIFAAATQRSDRFAGKQPRQAARHGKPHRAIAHDGAGDALVHDERRESAARGFDFGQFRHGKSCLSNGVCVLAG